MICVRCIVSGRVQGVWFRETTRQKALELGLAGQALNLADGTVEVTACGKAASVQELQEWLWTGSPMSKVDEVRCEELPDGIHHAGFRTS